MTKSDRAAVAVRVCPSIVPCCPTFPAEGRKEEEGTGVQHTPTTAAAAVDKVERCRSHILDFYCPRNRNESIRCSPDRPTDRSLAFFSAGNEQLLSFLLRLPFHVVKLATTRRARREEWVDFRSSFPKTFTFAKLANASMALALARSLARPN